MVILMNIHTPAALLNMSKWFHECRLSVRMTLTLGPVSRADNLTAICEQSV
jgi:hypothetical protein